jgi:hypothetical protein
LNQTQCDPASPRSEHEKFSRAVQEANFKVEQAWRCEEETRCTAFLILECAETSSRQGKTGAVLAAGYIPTGKFLFDSLSVTD